MKDNNTAGRILCYNRLLKEIADEMVTENVLLKQLGTKLKDSSKDKIYTYKSRGHSYYRIKTPNGFKHISNDDPRIARTSARQFYSDMQKRLRQNLELLGKVSAMFKPYSPESVIEGLPAAFIVSAHEMYKELGLFDPDIWQERTVFNDESQPESRIIRTRQGFVVRSRVEALIAEMYYDKGIFVEYEEPLYVGNGRFIHPDFTIHTDNARSIRFHEHAGLMVDPDYRNELRWKIERYQDLGYRIGKDVLITYDGENGSLELDEISKQIDLFVSMR